MSKQEQFVYPRNKLIRNAYLAFLRAMHKQRRVRFGLHESIDIILNSQSMYNDTKGGENGPTFGPNGLKAQKLLRGLSTFIRPVGVNIFEVCAYGVDGIRITNFKDFYTLCLTDTHMAAQEPIHDSLVYKPWTDTEVQPANQSNSSMQKEIADVLSATISTDDNSQHGTLNTPPQYKEQPKESLKDVEYTSASSGRYTG